ncbi:YihY/virulence factor BrkB family protein [Gordonia sp. (in: high G+C Gram-positive bacteria)]|uniref:YihY/virulence factor BrkB family protein n=1 Tax=Gordonia sp. (in: high G+C Gram-positive bacteria) TaxID=84139 RepID=UPI002605DECE|nr:YihY/virulence factor BrkB family protein [Gordonia sp. (in: high G+C Gram-positive bacteria)]
MLVPISTDGPRPAPPADGEHSAGGSALRKSGRLVWRTTVKSWDDGIIGWSAQAAFWQALSLPPLLLGVIGSLGYIGGWFGPDTVQIISDRIVGFSGSVFTEQVVDDLIRPTVDNVLHRGRGALISLSFVMSLWAGSSAMSCFVAAIVTAHDQHQVRNPVWQRIFALIIYIVFLITAVLLLPLVALGPTYLIQIVPADWGKAMNWLITWGYFPFVGLLLIGVLVLLYRFALPYPLPWLRLVPGAFLAGVFFWVATYILRAYLTALAKTGYTYGALATPIAFLLFGFFLGFSIVLGAEFNAAIQDLWPREHNGPVVRQWVSTQTSEITDTLRRRAIRPGQRPRRPAPQPVDDELGARPTEPIRRRPPTS